MSVKYWWNNTDGRKLKYSREESVPLALYPPQHKDWPRIKLSRGQYLTA